MSRDFKIALIILLSFFQLLTTLAFPFFLNEQKKYTFEKFTSIDLYNKKNANILLLKKVVK